MSTGKIAACSVILSGAILALSIHYAAAQDANSPPPPPPPEATPPGAPPPPPPGAPPPPPGAGAPPPPAAAGAPPPAIVGTSVNLRQGPGTTYPIVTLIPAGAPVAVSGCNAGWCQVSFQGQSGFIIATSLGPPRVGPGGPPPPYPYPPGYVPPPPPVYVAPPPYYGPCCYGPYWHRGYRRW